MKRLALFISLLVAVSGLACAQAEQAVIVHPQSQLQQISDRELEQVFLSKTKYLPSGERARPVELTSTEWKSDFYKKVTGKDEVELRKYWAAIVFTGGGQPPKQLRSVEQVLDYVRTHPGAIAYDPREVALDDSVKVLKYID